MNENEEHAQAHPDADDAPREQTDHEVIEDEHEQAISPEEPDIPSDEHVRASPLAVFGILASTLLFAGGGVWFVTNYTFAPQALTLEQASLTAATPTPPLVRETPPEPTLENVTFPREGFAMSLPEGWLAAPNITTLPAATQNATNAFALPGTACTIVYAQLHTDDAPAQLKQSAGYIDIKNGDQLLGRIERRIPLIHASTSSSSLMHSNAPFLAHEFAFSYQPLFYTSDSADTTRNAFLLFAPPGTVVATTCLSDFTKLIASIHSSTPDYTLSPNDSGVLTIEHAAHGTDLLFRASSSKQLFRIAHLSDGAIVQPTVSDNTLYYTHNSGTLYALPLFGSNTPYLLPIPLETNERVNDFVVATNTIEYLRGTWCRSAPEDCALTHESYDLLTGMITTLETDVSTPTLNADEVTTQSLTLEDGILVAGPQNPEGIAPLRIPIVTY